MKTKLVNVAEDLIVDGRSLTIGELEGKYLCDEDSYFDGCDWYYTVYDASSQSEEAEYTYNKITLTKELNMNTGTVTVDTVEVGKVLIVFAVESGTSLEGVTISELKDYVKFQINTDKAMRTSFTPQNDTLIYINYGDL